MFTKMNFTIDELTKNQSLSLCYLKGQQCYKTKLRIIILALQFHSVVLQNEISVLKNHQLKFVRLMVVKMFRYVNVLNRFSVLQKNATYASQFGFKKSVEKGYLSIFLAVLKKSYSIFLLNSQRLAKINQVQFEFSIKAN
mgnify:CR=1 FL=1